MDIDDGFAVADASLACVEPGALSDGVTDPSAEAS